MEHIKDSVSESIVLPIIVGICVYLGMIGLIFSGMGYVLENNEATYPLGDLTRNGVVTEADVKALSEIVLKIVPVTDTDKVLGDINGDGRLTSTDITLLVRQLEKEEKGE